MQMGTIFILGLVVYVLACMAIGIIAYRKGTRTIHEYYLAGKTIGLVVFAFAVTGSIFSSWYFLGNHGLIWSHGLAGASWYIHTPMLALAAWILWRGQWILSKKYGFVTSGDILGTFFESNVVRILTALIAVLYALPYVAAQMWGAGYLLQTLSQGSIPFEFGAYILAGIIGFYVIMGGMRSTAWTSTMQGALLIVGSLILITVVLSNTGTVGFWAKISQNLGNEFITMPGPVGGFPWRYAVTFAFVTGFGIPSSPVYTLWVNSIPARAYKVFRFYNFVMLACVMGIIYFVFSIITGVGGRILFPTLTAADAFIPTLMSTYMHPFLYIMVGIGAVAAAQSTADIALHTASTTVIRDVYVRNFKPDASDGFQTGGARVMTFILLVLSIFVARNFSGLIAVWGSLAVSFGLQLFPAWIGALYWPRATSAGVSAGILVGIPITIWTFFLGMPLRIHAGFWGFMANVVVFLVVSYMTKHPSMETIKDFHGVLKKHIYGM